MKYEVVREIFNMCDLNKMRDIFIEEKEVEDPDAYVKEYCEGKDAIMTGIMANVASAQNIRQYGVIPDFAAVREFAYQQAENLYEQYRKEEIG